MKNLFKIFTVVIILVISVVSCQDYLDVPVNGQIVQDNFYNTDEEANAAILTAYDVLTWNMVWDWVAPVLVKTLPTDESTAGGANFEDQLDYNTLDDYVYDEANAKVGGFWALNYFGIYRANTVLDFVEGDSDTKARIRGEALGLRAYYYMELVSMYGDLPLLTTTLITPEEYDRPRSSTSDVYAQIESDLTAAIAALPNRSEYGASDLFRLTKGAAMGLLAKAQVFQGKNSEAAATVQSIVDSGEYALEEDFASIFGLDGEFGSGSMLEAVFFNAESVAWGTEPWGAPKEWETNMHIQLMGPREGAFGGESAGNNLREGWGFNYPSPKLYDAYIAAGDEERRLATVISEQEWIDGGGDFSGDAHDYNGFLRVKYGSKLTENSTEEGSSPQLSYTTNWRLLRYADVLLIGAEGAANAGNETQAREFLNMVRNRAGLDDSTASGGDLIDAIINERFLELAFEGFRFHDMVRWGRAADNFDGFQTGKHELFPIPVQELLKAESLTQNPGW